MKFDINVPYLFHFKYQKFDQLMTGLKFLKTDVIEEKYLKN